MTDSLKKTPLHQSHVDAKAKMVDFGGWHMPVQYAGILEEHNTVRTKAGLFDVSHMGEIDLQGPNALDLIQKLITNDASKLSVKQALYSPMCFPDGGIVDDLLIYRKGKDHFLLVVNASNTEKDYQWIVDNAIDGVEIQNISPETAQIALQGPLAEAVLQKLCDKDLSRIKYYWFDNVTVDGEDCLVSRTGYTGEDGFEIYLPSENGHQVWNAILKAGEEEGVTPIGLGARDTLRFEARLPLYGNELSEDISPLEAGLGIFVKLDKKDFIGKEALAKQKAEGLKRKTMGFEMLDRGIPRSHYKVLKDGQEIGFVTSGSFAPTLGKNIGLALIKSEYAQVGSNIEIQVRTRSLKAQIIKTPFYKKEAK